MNSLRHSSCGSFRISGWSWGSGDEGGNEGAEECLSALTSVVNELEEAEIGGQFLLGDAAVGTQPGAQQRPEALDRVDVDLAEAVAVVIACVFAMGMADGLVAVAPVFQTSIDVVLVGMDQGALGDGFLDDGLDRRLLDIGQHLEDNLPTALDQAQDRWFLLLQGAATRGAFQPTPPPEPPLFSTSAG